MAVVHLNSTAGTTATMICQVQSGLSRNVAIQIQNGDSASIWIGDASITASGATKGHLITAGTTFQLWLNSGDKVYAVSSAGTAAGAIVITYSGI
jgi:hypothetical protein